VPIRRLALLLAPLAAIACYTPPAPTTYRCEGGDSLVLGVAFGYAELHLPPDRVVRLWPTRSASGARYTDGRYAVHTKGGEALLERGGRVVLQGCRVGTPVAAVDSASTPERAMELADSIDQLTTSYAPTERRLQPPEPGWEPGLLRLWADSAGPVRLDVTPAGPPGASPDETRYYFVDGKVAVVRGPVDQYVFRDTALILWTTDSLHVPADVPLRDMVARQNFVLGEVRQLLAMFGLEP